MRQLVAVRIRYLFFFFFLLIWFIYNCYQSSGVEVDVISHKRQRFVLFLSTTCCSESEAINYLSYAVWFGGSLLASLVSALLQRLADYQKG